MEITDSTIGVFYVSKALALAPISLHRNQKGVLEIRRSIIFTVYTLVLILGLVFLTYRGLLFDANSKIPVRMKSATSKVVTALDVSVVVLAAVAGALCGILGLKPIRELNARLRKIDDTLHSYKHFKRDRLRSILLITIPLLIICGLLGLDVTTWLRVAESMNVDESNTEMNIQGYIPFYSLYLVLTGLHITFANTAFGISLRYHRINIVLRNTFLKDTKKEESPVPPKVLTVKSLLDYPSTLSSSLTKVTSESMQNEGKGKVMVLKIMADNHGSLAKCVTIISSSYGMAVLFILISCLLHLVATAYFLFLELLSKKDNGNIWLQVLWIMFHAFRLLMVVEPCHLATKESRKTMQIICEMERKAHEPILAEEIKKFWQQLLVLDAVFSANGLCRVDRKILTSVSSAIATYLIILIQFQKTNG